VLLLFSIMIAGRSPWVNTLPRLSRVLVPVHKLLPHQSAIKPPRTPWYPPSCPRRSNLLCRLLAVRTAPVLLPWLGVAGKKCRVRFTCSRYIHTILDLSFFFLSYFGVGDDYSSAHDTHVHRSQPAEPFARGTTSRAATVEIA